ncbi:MAG TPA: hypothetical protein DHV93_00415 [Holophagaceae bacterium]|nr:hypothetical protein [Holophagaceae bacterium]
MLALGLGAGLVLGQQGCGRREAPAKREAPEPKKPEKKSAEPKAKPSSEAVRPQSLEPERPLPRLALVIDDLGYVQPELVTRLCSLPVPFSVAVLPYQEFTRDSADIAHRLGKEVMLHLPMEPIGYPGPGRDPGPNAILYNLSETEVRRRVRMALDEIPHRTGVNNHMGSRITPDRTRMGWVLQEVKARKCFFVDSRTEKDSVAFAMAEQLGIPAVERRVFLDDDKAFPEMEKQWERALKLAEKDGSVLIIGHIYPETVEALEKLVPRSKAQVRFVKAGELAR